MILLKITSSDLKKVAFLFKTNPQFKLKMILCVVTSCRHRPKDSNEKVDAKNTFRTSQSSPGAEINDFLVLGSLFEDFGEAVC